MSKELWSWAGKHDENGRFIDLPQDMPEYMEVRMKEIKFHDGKTGELVTKNLEWICFKEGYSFNNNATGKRIQSKLKEVNSSSEELAKKIGEPVEHIDKIISGSIRPPFETIVRAAKELHVSPVWLIGCDEKNVSNNDIKIVKELLEEIYRAVDEDGRKKLLKTAVTVFDNNMKA